MGHLAYFISDTVDSLDLSAQREADAARGRNPDDERQPRHADRTPRRGRKYKRDFGVPEDTDQEGCTDPESRIMKHSCGGFEQGYNGYAASLTQCCPRSFEIIAPSSTEANQLVLNLADRQIQRQIRSAYHEKAGMKNS